MQIIKAGVLEHWEKDNMHIHCMFNYNCNFSCSYCVNRHIRSGRLHNTQLKLDAMQKCITNILSLKRDKFEFAIGGGEPTLYKHIHEFYALVEQHKKRDIIYVEMVTNGSTLNKVVLPLIEASPHIKKNFRVSIHEEQMSLEKYKEILKDFKYKDCIEVKYLAKPKELDKALEFKEYCTSLGYRFILQAIVIGPTFDPEYTEEELKIILKNDFRPDFYAEFIENENIIKKTYTRADYSVNQELANFNNLYCLAGRNYINLTPEGEVYRCFSDTTGIKFNINENSILDYPNLLKVKPCTVERCYCYAIAFPKWQKGTPAPHYIKESELE